MHESSAHPLSVATLDLTHLALFVGMAANDWVLSELRAHGFSGLRNSHGFLVQHLLTGPKTVGELAHLLGISQQAVSKSAKELLSLKLVEQVASSDRRVTTLALAARGQRVVAASRAARARLLRKLEKRCGAQRLAQAQQVLGEALQVLGGVEAVETRRVRPMV